MYLSEGSNGEIIWPEVVTGWSERSVQKMHCSVWQYPNQERANQNAWISSKTTLPYNKNSYTVQYYSYSSNKSILCQYHVCHFLPMRLLRGRAMGSPHLSEVPIGRRALNQIITVRLLIYRYRCPLTTGSGLETIFWCGVNIGSYGVGPHTMAILAILTAV